jgi:hypothetical protein
MSGSGRGTKPSLIPPTSRLPAPETEVEQRSLADYDSALGLAGFDGGVAW